LTYEARWISDTLGPTQMGAYAIAHGAKAYLQNLVNVWRLGTLAKIGTAIGAADDREVSRIMQMSFWSAMAAGVLQWAFYAPFGPWLLRSVYKATPEVYPWAIGYLRVRALGESFLMFFSDSAMSILQGMQFLSAYVAFKLFDYLYTWAADYVVFEVARWSIIADAWSRVLREVFLFVFAFGFLWYVLYRRPDTKGRFQLTGPKAPRPNRSDWKLFLGHAGWIILTSYSDMAVTNVTGVLTSRLSTDEASANR
jgi:Na+-driven multidrug efflux pump